MGRGRLSYSGHWMDNRLARALVGLALVLSGLAHAAPLTQPLPETPRPPSGPAAPAPKRERTVLLLGDSLLTSGFGKDLETKLDAHPLIQCKRRARSSTGLARPDFFDWMEVGRQEVERVKPDVVVVILGGNDGQGLTDGKGKAVSQWGDAKWEDAYRQRVEGFLQVLGAPGRKVLWLELPATGLPRFERKLALIRRVQREVLATHEEARHLETGPFFLNAKGKPLVSAKVEGFRKPMKLRMDDGVHFTGAGGRYFADKVYPEVLGVLGLADEVVDAGPHAGPTPTRTAGASRR